MAGSEHRYRAGSIIIVSRRQVQRGANAVITAIMRLICWRKRPSLDLPVARAVVTPVLADRIGGAKRKQS